MDKECLSILINEIKKDLHNVEKGLNALQKTIEKFGFEKVEDEDDSEDFERVLKNLMTSLFDNNIKVSVKKVDVENDD